MVFNGLLSGTFAPTGCRSSWCARSPLTGIWGESNMGGHWGAELRFAGYDGLVITGRAEQPVYLWIDGQAARSSCATPGHLWGHNHYHVFDAIRAETDPKTQMACIGEAGERLVRYAGVMQGGIEHARTAGRTGMGAVMGSKNLKAIAVRGKERPAYHDAKGFRDAVKASNAIIKDGAMGLTMLGTAGGVPGTEKYGDLPLSNWRGGSWDKAADISGQRIAETIFERHTFCFACPIGCGKTVTHRRRPLRRHAWPRPGVRDAGRVRRPAAQRRPQQHQPHQHAVQRLRHRHHLDLGQHRLRVRGSRARPAERRRAGRSRPDAGATPRPSWPASTRSRAARGWAT